MGRIQYSNEGTYVVACMVLLLVLFVVGWRLVSRVLRCLRFVSGKKRSAQKKGSCCGGMFTSVVVHAVVFCCAGYVLYSVRRRSGTARTATSTHVRRSQY